MITESCSKALGLRRDKADVVIKGVGGSDAAHSRWRVSLRLESCVSSSSVDVEALVVNQVTGRIPHVPINSKQWDHLKNIPLADPLYYQPGDVDILLGADVCISILRAGQRLGPKHSPAAVNTIFGWVLTGRVSIAVNEPQIIQSYHVSCTDRLEGLVQRFWKLEEVSHRKPMSNEEKSCEAFFEATTKRKTDGRYIVRLPFKKNEDSSLQICRIGETRALAERRLLSLEKRFVRNPQQQEAYIKFMREYISLGHMQPIATHSKNVYIPHHYVIKEDSSTTKLRVVFDASMASSNGLSLNKTLMVGPTVQEDLYSLLVRFRFNVIALKADITKMYRQFEIHPDDQQYQCILWRENPSHPIKDYALKTVTYGTASAPYLATRSLNKLAEDERSNFPIAAELIQSSMYIDDLLGGKSTTEEAIHAMQELIQLVKSGGMEIRKWCSNDPEVMKLIPEELRESGSNLMFDEDAAVKTLGVTWQPTEDYFTFYTKTNPTAGTKRELLSEIAKTFDPLGLISPFTINLKILFQSLWETKVDCDDHIPQQFQDKWAEYQQQLGLLSILRIPRCVVSTHMTDCQLIGFSDASERALACSVYFRYVMSDNSVRVNLMSSRTRVAPVKQCSVPRLELCAALLLVETIEPISNTIKFNCPISCYTDSIVVLKWLSSQSRRWKMFVASRVAAIQDVVPAEQWHHVRTPENPADLPSRGLSAEDLISSTLWWHGPEWLSSHQPSLTVGELVMEDVVKEERPKSVLTHISTTSTPFIIRWCNSFSNLRRLVGATAVIQRFVQYLKTKPITNPGISAEDRKRAKGVLVQLVQYHHFQDDIKSLQKSGEVQCNSKLKTLTPFLDKEGLLRVGGRLNFAPVHQDKKHPILLPKHSHLTRLIVEESHQQQLHSGVGLTHTNLRQSYWILGGKDLVRLLIRRCIKCRKVKGETIIQQMGQLPTSRVSCSRPFLHCGIDYAGPFNIRRGRGRGIKSEKGYFAIFVCLATKAVHLEAVSSLNTEDFLAALKRFIARRGICSHIYSDCGTNFVGANRELKQLMKKTEEDLQHELSHLSITWHFNPPGSPHQGGLWEAGVKSVKYHMKRTMGNSIITMEQFQTLLCNIEACLNSRPLVSISSDPNDFTVLTPGHFLIGEPLTAIPEPSVLHLTENRLSYWQDIQQRTQHFWQRWSNEYLTTLQQRYKWIKKQSNLCIGDLVAIKEENLPPTKWRLGRVVTVSPGADGLVRKVSLRTVVDMKSNSVKYGEITRAVHKLSPILLSNEIQ